jgi:hypothetical protein
MVVPVVEQLPRVRLAYQSKTPQLVTELVTPVETVQVEISTTTGPAVAVVVPAAWVETLQR